MLRNYELFKLTGNDFLPSFAAEISALDKKSARDRTIECVDLLIRDVALLQKGMALLRKPNFPLLNAAKTGFHRKKVTALQALKVFSSILSVSKTSYATAYLCGKTESAYNYNKDGTVMCYKRCLSSQHTQDF